MIFSKKNESVSDYEAGRNDLDEDLKDSLQSYETELIRCNKRVSYLKHKIILTKAAIDQLTRIRA